MSFYRVPVHNDICVMVFFSECIGDHDLSQKKTGPEVGPQWREGWEGRPMTLVVDFRKYV